MADDRSPSGTEAPWWQDPGRIPTPAPEEPDAGKRGAQPPPPELTWFERREPFLKALSARIEPVEELARRAAIELRDLRAELKGFAEDTERTLAALAARVSQQHTDATGRADSLGRQLVEETEKLTWAIRDEVGTTAEAMATGVQDAAGKAVDAALGRMDRAEEALRARLGEAERSLRARLDEIDKALQERVGGAEHALRARLDDLDEAERTRLSDAAAGLGGGIDALGARLEPVATHEDAESLRAMLEASARSLRQAVGEARNVVERSLTSAASSLKEGQVREGERLTRTLAGPMKALQSGLDRVERLSAVIESLGHRRGFRELVESEEALRKEQSAFVDRLSSASDAVAEGVSGLAQRISLLEERLAALAEQAASLEQLPGHASERVASAMERMRSTLEESLEQRMSLAMKAAIGEIRSELERGVPVQDVLARLQELARAQGELAKAQQQVEGTSDVLRGETVRLRTAIEGWGRPKTVPEVAAGVRDLEGRVEGLEERMASLAEDVAKRVTGQLLDALEARGRRGLFRR